MKRNEISDEEALSRLRELANATSRKLVDVANAVLEADKLL